MVFVDLAANYEIAKQASEGNSGKPIESIDGLGQEAFWDPHGFLMSARGEDLFVTVVFVRRGDQAKLIEQGKQILETMTREPVTRDRIGQSCPPETRGPDS